MILKFDSTGLTEVGLIEDFQGVAGLSLTVDYLLDDPSTPGYPEEGQIIGYRVSTADGDARLVTGDYIVFLKPKISVVTISEYANDVEKRRIVEHEVSVELMENLIDLINGLVVSDTVKIDLMRHVGPTLDMIVTNRIQAANVIANALPTTTNFTQNRKNAFLAVIGTALAKL